MLVSNLFNLRLKNDHPSFKAARVNILAKADEHGYVSRSAQFYDTVQRNQSDIFQKPEDSSSLNLMLLPGDIFMNPSKKGFRTHSRKTNGDIQADFLNTSIQSIKKLLGPKARFDAVFTPGNHDFDGGDKTFFNLLKNVDVTPVMTNIDYRKSTALKMLEKNKVVNSKIYQIPDDKNPNLNHHVMILGVTIPSMDFYNPGLMKGMQFVDNCNKKDSQISEKDLAATFELLNKKVRRFKQEFPKGAVILMSHTGTPISSMIRDNVPGINEILNGHDHMNFSSTRGITHISSLGQNNEMFKSIRLNFDDNGDLDLRETNTYFTNTHPLSGKEPNPMQDLYDYALKKDIQSIITLKCPEIEDELSYSDEIRYKNSYLANYLTSSVKKALKEHDPDIAAVGIQSSIIRGGIKNGSTNIDLMKVFDGVSEDLSTICSGPISGENLVGLIGENIKTNIKAPTRNTIIQWSDIFVNRSMIEKNPDCDLFDAIKIRNKDTRQFERIKPDGIYKIAIAEKYLVKDDIEFPKKIRKDMKPIGKTYDELFRQNLEFFDYYIKVTDKIKEQRIV